MDKKNEFENVMKGNSYLKLQKIIRWKENWNPDAVLAAEKELSIRDQTIKSLSDKGLSEISDKEISVLMSDSELYPEKFVEQIINEISNRESLDLSNENKTKQREFHTNREIVFFARRFLLYTLALYGVVIFLGILFEIIAAAAEVQVYWTLSYQITPILSVLILVIELFVLSAKSKKRKIRYDRSDEEYSFVYEKNWADETVPNYKGYIFMAVICLCFILDFRMHLKYSAQFENKFALFKTAINSKKEPAKKIKIDEDAKFLFLKAENNGDDVVVYNPIEMRIWEFILRDDFPKRNIAKNIDEIDYILLRLINRSRGKLKGRWTSGKEVYDTHIDELFFLYDTKNNTCHELGHENLSFRGFIKGFKKEYLYSGSR